MKKQYRCYQLTGLTWHRPNKARKTTDEIHFPDLSILVKVEVGKEIEIKNFEIVPCRFGYVFKGFPKHWKEPDYKDWSLVKYDYIEEIRGL